MLKVGCPIDYLKKEKNNSEASKVLEEVQHIEQAQKFSELKRYRRFDSDDEREKNTELFSAIKNDDLQKVQGLLKAGVKVNIIDKNNKDNTPLHYAIEREKKEIAEKLLQEWNADINAKNSKGDTPLHIATSKDNKELVQLLISKNANIDIKNNEDRTSLDIAKRLKREDIVKILESHIQQISVEEQPAKQERPSEENKLENTDQKNQRSETIPYSDKLPLDKDLKLSNGNFKSIIESDIKPIELNTADKLNFLNRPAYPDERILVHFASRVYKEKEDGQELPDKKLPEGWKILTTAYNQDATNHYFGAAYWNPGQQQIVIAHRGTDPSSTGALWTDIRGILQNNYVPQISSAVTFADKIKTVLEEFNKESNINLQLSFTGHSLGGWLAQITTFTTKYFSLESFEDKGSYFVKSEKVGYHAHTVVFDSPGGKDILSKIKGDFDVRYRKDSSSLSTSDLDIASYLSAPNLVNTCCSHLGSIYRVFIKDLSPRSSFDFGQYTIETHAIEKIEKVIGLDELKAVIDWPLVKKGITKRALEKLSSTSNLITGILKKVLFRQSESEILPESNEYEYFHKLAKGVIDYDPEPDDKGGYCVIRYQVQDVDKAICSTNTFSQLELDFLNKYQQLRKIRSPTDLFSSLDNEAEQIRGVLENFKIKRKEKIIRCNSEEELHKLTRYIKNMLHFFPEIKSRMKNIKVSEPIWFDLRESVQSFTGREEQLDQIVASIEQGIIVISGLGGVGKSELAIEYARSRYSKEDSVMWIDAETHETAKDSFRRLMKELKLKTRDQDGDEKSVGLMAREVYDFFAGKKSLFIFDNAKEHSIIKEFLPLSTSGYHVLITSQNLELFNEQEHGKIKRLNLNTLPEDKATEFVKKALNINNTLQDKEIKELVETLGYLPLALQHAVAYIKESGYVEGIGKCVEIYKRSEQEIQSFLNREGLSSYDKTIFLTFKTTIDRVKKEENGKLAEEILNTIAYFASDNIPKETFLKLAQDKVEESDVNIKNDRASGMLTRAINLLGKYYIINLKEEQVSIHRLVQEVIRSELKKQSEEGRILEEGVLEKALGLLREYTKASPGNAASCIPHIISIWNYASKYDELIKSFIIDSTNNKATTSTTYFNLIIEGSNYEVIDAIIKKISSNNLKEVINAKNKDDVTPLHKAILRDDEKIVKLLIDEGADVNAKKSNGWTPLHLAAKNGNLEVVNALLAKGANIDDKTSSKYQFTPLHLAARNGYKEVVEALLASNANVNAKTGYEFTPLHLAAGNGCLDVVQALLKNDQIIINAETKDKFTPLHLAAKSGHLSVVEALLGKGADINAQNKDGFTSLHFAAFNGHAKIVNELLENYKVNIDARMTNGNTPLHLAAEKDHLEIVKALIAKNADIDIKNGDGNTASDLAHSEVKDYISSIYKRTKGAAGIEGQLCEINLSMLLLLKGVTDERMGNFHLASNMEKADKFDDIVFKYEYREGIIEKSKIIFLQAKHKTDQKGVNINSLLSDSESGDFSLKKYFISYRKIKQQFSETKGPVFSSNFEDSEFIIYTNAPFASTDSSIKERNIDQNDFLRISDLQSKYYQLEFNSDKKERIVNLLKDSSDSRRLAKELVQSISSGKGIDMQKDIFQSYHIALQGKVIEKIDDKGKLSDNFLNDDASLSLKDKEFRRVFLEEAGKVFKKQGNELKQELQNKVIKLSNKFGINSGSENLALPNDDPVAEDEIKDFLNKFKLFASQPSEKDLEKLIKDKVKEVYRVEQDDTNLIFSDIQNKVQKWWKQENKYLTEQDKLFKNAKENLSKLNLIGLAILNTGKIERLGLGFKSNQIERLMELIRGRQILNIITKRDTILLSSIKVYQALERMTEYKLEKDDCKYIFMSLSSVLNLQNKVIDTFNNQGSNLLVIECEAKEKNIEELYNQLYRIIRSSDSKKVILITQEEDLLGKKFKYDFSRGGEYKEEIDEKNSLTDLEGGSQEKLLKKEVIFQGEEVSLDTLVNDESKYLIGAEVLSKLINNEKIEIDKVPDGLGEIEYYYIDRIFNRRIEIKSECFKEKDIQDLFVMSNIEENELSSLTHGEKVHKFRNNGRDVQNPTRFIILDDDENVQKNLKQLYRDYQQYNIHWLKKEDDKFIWQESQGILSNLRKFVDKSGISEYQVSEVTSIADRVVIISAEPGMGKSTVLTKLAQKTKKSDPSLWVIRINLNDHTDNLNKISFSKNHDQAIDFLSNMVDLKTPLEQELLKRRINDQRKVALLFDGFDEISPTYKEKVIELLKILKDTKVEKLWITTRPYMKDELEDKLSALSYTLKPLSRDDQKKFLEGFWNKKLDLNLNTGGNQLNIYVEKLLNVLSNSIADKEVEFTGIPLQTRMLAEAFQDNFKEFYNSDQGEPNLPKKLDLVDLYQRFIDKKYNIYSEEKKKQNPTNVAVEEDNAELRKTFIRSHQKAALYRLFEKGELGDLFSNSEYEEVSEFIIRVRDGREKTGIIYQVINDNLSFIHRTFAEYFAAYWLADNQEKQKVKDFFLGKMFKGENEVLRNFFDRILAHDERGENKYEIHNAVLNEDKKKVQELLLDSQKAIDSLDKGGRTALHLAAAYGYKEIVQDLLNYGADVAKSDKVLNWSPLRYADKGNYWGIGELLLKKGADGNDMVEARNIIKNNVIGEKKETLLHLAAQKGYTNFAEILVAEGANINSKNKNGKTPLHQAAENGHLGIIKFLVNKKAEIDIHSSIGPPYRRRALNWTPLHWASLGNHIDVVKFLLDKNAKTIKDSNGFTPLDVAVQHGYSDVVKFLGGSEKDLLGVAVASDDLKLFMKLAESIDLQSWILYDAAINGSLEIVKFLVENGVKINMDGAPATPLAGAAGGGSLKVVKYLVEQGADVNIKIADGWTALHAAARASRSHEDSKDLNESHYLEIVKYFIEDIGRKRDINIDIIDKKGTTPLQTAAHHNRFNIVRYLIEKKADINAIDKLGATIVLSAAFNNNCEIVKFLIEKGAMIDSNQGILGELHITVLHIAAMYNALGIVRILVEEKKVNVNAGKGISLTPLHFAALSDNQEAIEYLIEHDADVNAVVNFSHIVKVLKEKKKALEDSSMYRLVDRVNNFFSKCLEIQALSAAIGLTPNIVSKLSGHKNKLLEERSNKNRLNKIRGWIVEKINPHIGDQLGMLKDFIEMRKVGNLESSPQKFMLYLPDGIDQKIHEDPDQILPEECLSSTNSGRRKREAEIGECEFSWEDVDEFNEEKDEKRDSSKIKIDGEKFVSYIKDLPEVKQSQLIQLADEVRVKGNSQGLVSKLISNQKVMHHLSKVGRISGMTMHGMMAKNVLADFLNGDYQGVAVNVGFIAGGQGFAKVAEAASLKGLKLASEGKLLLGTSLRAASPFLARGTSAFVVYDLVNQVKAFKNGTEEALVGVVGDSIYLGVDAAEIGIEVAEAFEVLEGVSSVTGPIGAAVGAVVFVGTDVYMAVKRVDKIDQLIHLTGKEKFIEGLRAFIGMQPENHIQELLQEKEVSDELVRQGLEYLNGYSDIQSYVFPTGKSVVDSCRKVPYQVSDCASGGFGGGCFRAKTITRYAEECTTKFEIDLDSTVLLDRKRTDIKWSRARPDNPSNGKLFCLPKGSDKPAPSYGSYLCENAIGLSANKTGNHTLISLGEGKDYAKGFLNSPNIFVVNGGSKEYYGGNKDDVFVLQTDYVKGHLSGQGGINTLDTTSFAFQEEPLNIQLHIGEIADYFRDNSLKVCKINKVIGRENKAETITVSCDGCNSNVKLIDGQSGSKEIKDRINIIDDSCSYQMQIIVRPNTVVYNRALEGRFDYVVPLNSSGSAELSFIYGPEKFNVNNTFWFAYEAVDIKSIDVKYINVFNRTEHEVKFNFVESNKEFNVTVSYPENPFYRIGKNGEVRIGNKDNLYMLQNRNESVEEIIKNYLPIANRLSKMSFFIQSLLSNETVVIGSGNHEVIHNNPVYRSHLVGNGGENVYVIDSEINNVPEVIIHDIDEENSIDTIDLRNVVKKARELQVIKLENDLLLRATVKEQAEYCTVRLKDGVERYNKTHVIVENAPMIISVDKNEWSLKPQPLMFEKDKEIIVVTDQDVEKGTELITPRKGGNYTFVRSNSNDLMITNAFDSSITKDDLCSITLSKFYETPKMKTLSIKFADKEVVLKDREKEISAARDVNIVKKEHKDQVYNEVFNRGKQQTRYRRHLDKEFLASSSTRPSSWINDLVGWVKSSMSGLLGSKATLPEISENYSNKSSTSQFSSEVCISNNVGLGFFLLQSFLDKKYPLPKFCSVTPEEALANTLNIVEEFEKTLEKTARQSDVLVKDVNFFKVYLDVAGHVRKERYSQVPNTLYSVAKEACPKNEKFLSILKGNIEKIFDEQQIVNSKYQANDIVDNKPRSYLNNTTVDKQLQESYYAISS